jgi:hypothetical protein
VTQSAVAFAFAAAVLGGACGRPPAPPPRNDAAVPAPWTAGACDADGHGWCAAYPRPTGAKLNRLWGSDPRDVWAVGDVGTILHYDGERWTRSPSGTQDSLVAISGRGPGDAWAIGKNRTLLHLSGGAWKTVEMPKLENEEELADLLVLPNGEAWIVGGMVQRSGLQEDIVNRCVVGHFDGAAWRFDEEDSCGPLGRVWGRAPNNVWADGGDAVYWNGRSLTKNPKEKPGAIVGRHGRASGWRLALEWGGGGAGPLVDPRRPKAGPGDVRDFWAFGPDDVWAIGVRGGLMHFDGTRWSRGDDPIALSAVAARAADDVWAVGADETLLHFDGHDWRSWRIPGAGGHRSIAVAAPALNDVFVLKASEQLLRFDGKRWTSVISKPPEAGEMYSLFARASDDVWVGAATGLLHWNGRVVETFALDFEPRQLFGNARELWAGGRLHRWDGSRMILPPGQPGPDGKGLFLAGGAMVGDTVWLAGAKWISSFAAGRLEPVKEAPDYLRTLWATPSGEIWAASAISVVHGHGSTWTVEQAPGLSEITTMGGAGDGLVWLLGREGLLFRR